MLSKEAASRPEPPAITAHPALSLLSRAMIAFGAGLLITLVAYLALAVPGRWFPDATPVVWDARQLQLVRGTGELVGDELVVRDVDPSGLALISVRTQIRASDYASIYWIATDVADNADVRIVWRTEYEPQKLQSLSILVESGRLRPVLLSDQKGWLGSVSGLALAVRGSLAQPIRIRGAVAKPMGAVEMIRDRLGDWLALESWSGTSINTITGGADIQELPMPLLIAVSAIVAMALIVVQFRGQIRRNGHEIALIFACVILVGWSLLDLRWTWNLVRQSAITAQRYAGKTWYDKHAVAEDAELFRFVEKARGTMPAEPARVFVAADAHYFRGRGAYHLYPHNVYFDPRQNAIPLATDMRTGDWLLVYRRHNIQYDASLHSLRWDGNQLKHADLKLAESGAALFLITGP